jgi:hypothetical protein
MTSGFGVQASNALREIKATAQKEVVIVSILFWACHVQLSVSWCEAPCHEFFAIEDEGWGFIV